MSRATVSERLDSWGRGVEPNRLKAILASLGEPPERKRILDYGCGQGAYVRRLRQKDIDCVGADLFVYPDWAKHSEALRLEKDDLFRQVEDSALPFPDNHFHTSFAFEVLEHCPDPLATLQEIVRVTSSGVVLSVPDCDTNHKLKQFDLAFRHWTDTTHLNFFTESTFSKLMVDAGLEIVGVGRAYKIDLHRCFWDHVELPEILKKIGRRVTKNRVPPYWSSILIRGKKPNAE